MKRLPFFTLDVFTKEAFSGNPLAVVLEADGLSDARMLAIAREFNLSETIFVQSPEDPAHSAKVRIFFPTAEIPFAGHPTLGTCHAWLEAGGEPRSDVIVQECGAGLVRIRRDGDVLAFAAPPLQRSGPLDEVDVERIAAGLGLTRTDIVDHQWCDNGPGWMAVLLESADQVLSIRPDPHLLAGLDVGVIGPHSSGDVDYEVRAFFPGNSGLTEDPVTGSLNAALAQWLIGSGRAPGNYLAAQGTAMGRAGRVHVMREGDDIWIGGRCVTVIAGEESI